MLKIIIMEYSINLYLNIYINIFYVIIVYLYVNLEKFYFVTEK